MHYGKLKQHANPSLKQKANAQSSGLKAITYNLQQYKTKLTEGNYKTNQPKKTNKIWKKCHSAKKTKLNKTNI